jgi:hypothetical protein
LKTFTAYLRWLTGSLEGTEPPRGSLASTLDACFKAHPLPPELIENVQAEFRREPAGKKQKTFRPIRG